MIGIGIERLLHAAEAGTVNAFERRQVLFLVRNVARANWITVDGTRSARSGARVEGVLACTVSIKSANEMLT